MLTQLVEHRKKIRSMPRVCCLILNYNDAETVLTLVSLIRDFSELDEILVVDNNSTDDSFDVLKNNSIDSYHLISTNRNGGYGYGNNYGIRYAKEVLGCDFVLLSNPDVVFTNELIGKLKTSMINHRDCAVVTAVQLDINNQPIKDFAWKIPTPLEYAVQNTRLTRLYRLREYKYEKIIENTENKVECVPGALILYDASKFLEVGGYDEDMFLFCEEVTIAIKLKQAGYTTLLLGKEQYRHEHSVSINKSIGSEKKKKLLMFTNRLIVMNKYMKASKLTIALAKMLQQRSLNKMLAQEHEQ